MLPKNDSDYVKSVAIASLALFVGGFITFFVIYGFLSDRILLAFILGAGISCSLFLKDVTQKVIKETKAAFSRLWAMISKSDQ